LTDGIRVLMYWVFPHLIIPNSQFFCLGNSNQPGDRYVLLAILKHRGYDVHWAWPDAEAGAFWTWESRLFWETLRQSSVV
jgi:hypothetical protein